MGLHEETVISRAAIHDMFLSLDEDTAFDATRLREIDLEWQNWIQSNKDAEFRIVELAREQEPKSEWWFWIDMLEELTPEQKSTL
jgi:hypothetical protein